MKYRKKPVVIDAEQFRISRYPYPNGVCVCNPETLPDFHVHTLEGALHVSDGDFIITGVKGERYPCRPDIFEATYEKVEP